MTKDEVIREIVRTLELGEENGKLTFRWSFNIPIDRELFVAEPIETALVYLGMSEEMFFEAIGEAYGKIKLINHQWMQSKNRN